MKEAVIIFACIEKNIGDDLFVYTLTRRYPDVEFIIESSANYGSLANISNLSFSKLLKAWQIVSTANPQNFAKKIIVKIGKCLIKPLLGKQKVAVYIVGNAFKNLSYKGISQSNWIRNRVELVDDFFLLSTNFGPYNDKRWKEDHISVFESMSDVCFRDKKSYELFKQIDSVRYAPDVVLSLGFQNKKRTNGKFVLISIIDCCNSNRSTKMNDYASSYEKKIAEIADAFIEKSYDVIIVDSNEEQDRPAAERIVSMITNRSHTSIFGYDGNFQKVFDLYSDAYAVIGTRLHTIILAWLFNVPVLPIVYDVKVENILNDYHYSGDRMRIDEMNDYLVEDIVYQIENYSFVLDNEVVLEAEKQFEKLDKQLKETNCWRVK
ncbi:MAG: polysaccharide pyruvyl transferase family protein [Eubacteriales bacterium]|nr:polysaccharide pyruvyl transferase family protein [Eubacteriales bacterium]